MNTKEEIEEMKALSRRFINYAKTTPNPMDTDEVINAVSALCDFDFDRQAKLMQFLNWTWLFMHPFGGAECHIPSKDEIIDAVIGHICDAYWKLDTNNSESETFKSGGFRIIVTRSKCTIEFVVNSGHSF